MVFTTQNALEIENNDKSFLEAGIHENVALVGVRKEKSVNGNLFIEFEFNKDGSKMTHTEWEPNKTSMQTDAEFKVKAMNHVSRILQIMSAWYPKEVLNSFEFSEFDELYVWVKQLMDAADKSKLVRLKVIYGNNGYTSLPKYAKYTFIESMDININDSKIKPLSIDLFIRPTMGDKESNANSASDTFMATATSVAPGDALPF